MGRTTRVLTEGIYFGEAPRWHAGRLWFSDLYAHAVKSVSLSGDVRTECTIDDRPSGLGWMPDGSMLIVSMTKRQVLRRTPDGNIRLHADRQAADCNSRCSARRAAVVSAGGSFTQDDYRIAGLTDCPGRSLSSSWASHSRSWARWPDSRARSGTNTARRIMRRRSDHVPGCGYAAGPL